MQHGVVLHEIRQEEQEVLHVHELVVEELNFVFDDAILDGCGELSLQISVEATDNHRLHLLVVTFELFRVEV